MNRIVQIQIFNDLLNQLFEFLDANFPLFRSDILLTKSTVDLLKKSNPRLVVEQLMKCLNPYRDKIFSCNENFFIDFDKNLSSSRLTTDDILFGIKLRNVWLSSDITDIQKAYIWMYFQKLIKAGDRVL